ncbi:hypothetical protein AAFC00_001780 [Neodothiora populina]|uniref:Uncharacterized protein n=1 Tax=Neodothiora populina TaxID=2781224 RepID=A0ABR3PQ43_9PEZI
MRIAEILSDLTSLRACDPAAALALLAARPSSSTSDGKYAPSLDQRATTAAALGTFSDNETDADVDLARARDLLDLHKSVERASGASSSTRTTLDYALLRAREDVRAVVTGLV